MTVIEAVLWEIISSIPQAKKLPGLAMALLVRVTAQSPSSAHKRGASVPYNCSLIHMKIHFPVHKYLVGKPTGHSNLGFLHHLPRVFLHKWPDHSTRSKRETGCP